MCDRKQAKCLGYLGFITFDPGNAFKVLQAPACLTTAKFHPTEAGLITAGGHSGEIYVWNAFSDSDSLIASSGVGSIHGHKVFNNNILSLN